jgi:hypothetical protein
VLALFAPIVYKNFQTYPSSVLKGFAASSSVTGFVGFIVEVLIVPVALLPCCRHI